MSIKGKENAVAVTFVGSQFKSLIEAVEKLAKAVAVTQIKENQNTEQKARFLRVFGMTEYEIANILGITQPAVAQALKSKKKRQKVKKEISK